MAHNRCSWEERGVAWQSQEAVSLGPGSCFIASELSTIEGPAALVAAAEDRLEGIEVVVNNAGRWSRHLGGCHLSGGLRVLLRPWKHPPHRRRHELGGVDVGHSRRFAE
jgi:hypothetical protein